MSISTPVLLRVSKKERASLPVYGSTGAAGADISACLEEDLHLNPGEYARISTGLCLEIPEGYEVQVRPRSGLAAKHGITVLNTPGTIDHDYRGEVQVILINHGKEPFTVTHGMRVAQIVVAPVSSAIFVETCAIDASTERGIKGFGSTGTH